MLKPNQARNVKRLPRKRQKKTHNVSLAEKQLEDVRNDLRKQDEALASSRLKERAANEINGELVGMAGTTAANASTTGDTFISWPGISFGP